MDKLIDKIKEISKDPKGKAFLFFGFYIVFFAIVFLFINLSDSTLTYGDDYERSSSSNINLDYIFTNNFSFKYDVNLDNNIYSYIGAKKDEEETIKFNNLEYYRNSNLFYILTSLLVFIVIIFVCIRAICDKGMLLNKVMGYGINFNYFSDFIIFMEIMLYGLIVSNLLFMLNKKSNG